ncbi:MAG: hypothetical protein IKT39_05315 [Clostridia bacterium]|nr:hypothetical protein [Clostridia bacterium]
MSIIKNILRKVLEKLPESVLNEIKIKRAKNLPCYFSDERLRKCLQDLYFNKTGRYIDLDNPVTFSEKLQWLKLYYQHKDLARVVDKYHFKKYIEEKIGKGYTVPLYGAWKNVKDINWDKLPSKFVLKSNCCSDGNFIKIIKNKADVDFDNLKKELEDWLNPYKTLVNSYCRAYWKVKPMILAEEYVEQLDGQVYDYKFFCFGGEPKFAYVATDHFEGQISNISLYDLNWNRLDITYGVHPQNMVDAPNSLKEMIEISKKLSKEFPFVRVDFFELEGKPVLSELTFYPGGGFNEINPSSADKEWGDMIILPHKCVKK